MREIEFRRNAINPTECLKLGWDTFTSRFWLFLGVCLFLGFPLVTLVQFVSPFPAFFTQIISAVISGGISTGIFYIVLTEIDGKRADFTMIAKVLPSVSAIGLIALIGATPGLILGAIVSRNSNVNDIFMTQEELTAIGPWIFIFTLLGIVISFFLYFAYPLIAEYRLGAIETIKLSSSAALENARGIIILGLINFLITLAAVFIGVFFLMAIGARTMALGAEVRWLPMIPLWFSLAVSVSLSYAVVAHAYRHVFPKCDRSVI